MKWENSNSTALLLLNSEPKNEIASVKRWFKNSSYLTFETNDIFQALEGICDFTVSSRPDVILLEVASFSDEFPLVNRFFRTFFTDGEIKILALSDSGKILNEEDCFEGTFAELKTELKRIKPKYTSKRASV